jgi:hypothetical protein
MTMSIKTVRHKYSRHIDIRWQYIRKLCFSGVVKLIPLRTHHMFTDCSTVAQQSILSCLFRTGESDDLKDNESSVTSESAFS